MGVGWEYGFAPNWSFGVEYDHLFMGDANNSFTSTDPRLARFLNKSDQPGRGYGHLARELPLRRLRRRLRRPGGRKVLTSS